MEKYLKINNDPNIEGDFVETTDTNSPFVVVNFKTKRVITGVILSSLILDIKYSIKKFVNYVNQNMSILPMLI
jgi:hypothetical protein